MTQLEMLDAKIAELTEQRRAMASGQRATFAAQVRAARGLLRMSQQELSVAARIGLTSIRQIENEERDATDHMQQFIQTAFRNHGVTLAKGVGGCGSGVCFIKDPQ